MATNGGMLMNKQNTILNPDSLEIILPNTIKENLFLKKVLAFLFYMLYIVNDVFAKIGFIVYPPHTKYVVFCVKGVWN